jgi:hypothetical protein
MSLLHARALEDMLRAILQHVLHALAPEPAWHMRFCIHEIHVDVLV